MACSRARLIGGIDGGDLIRLEPDIESRYGGIDLLKLRRSEDRRRHARSAQGPRQGYLSGLNAACRCGPLDSLRDRDVARATVDFLGEIVGAKPRSRGAAVAAALGA